MKDERKTRERREDRASTHTHTGCCKGPKKGPKRRGEGGEGGGTRQGRDELLLPKEGKEGKEGKDYIYIHTHGEERERDTQ